MRPGQFDIDSLPEYEKLDPILKVLIEKKGGLTELVNKGHELTLIRRVQTLLKKSKKVFLTSKHQTWEYDKKLA